MLKYRTKTGDVSSNYDYVALADPIVEARSYKIMDVCAPNVVILMIAERVPSSAAIFCSASSSTVLHKARIITVEAALFRSSFVLRR
jgi:hypothetical protein